MIPFVPLAQGHFEPSWSNSEKTNCSHCHENKIPTSQPPFVWNHPPMYVPMAQPFYMVPSQPQMFAPSQPPMYGTLPFMQYPMAPPYMMPTVSPMPPVNPHNCEHCKQTVANKDDSAGSKTKDAPKDRTQPLGILKRSTKRSLPRLLSLPSKKRALRLKPKRYLPYSRDDEPNELEAEKLLNLVNEKKSKMPSVEDSPKILNLQRKTNEEEGNKGRTPLGDKNFKVPVLLVPAEGRRDSSPPILRSLSDLKDNSQPLQKKGNAGDVAFHGSNWQPTLDVVETGDHFVLSFEIPGVNRSDVEVKIADSMLVVQGNKRAPSGKLLATDSSYGEFIRRVPLPKELAETSHFSSYRDGVLEVMLQKNPCSEEERRPIKKIPITFEGAESPKKNPEVSANEKLGEKKPSNDSSQQKKTEKPKHANSTEVSPKASSQPAAKPKNEQISFPFKKGFLNAPRQKVPSASKEQTKKAQPEEPKKIPIQTPKEQKLPQTDLPKDQMSPQTDLPKELTSSQTDLPNEQAPSQITELSKEPTSPQTDLPKEQQMTPASVVPMQLDNIDQPKDEELVVFEGTAAMEGDSNNIPQHAMQIETPPSVSEQPQPLEISPTPEAQNSDEFLSQGNSAKKIQRFWRGHATRKLNLLDSMKKIRAINKQVDDLCHTYLGKLGDFNMIRAYEEELTNQLLQLDSISSGGCHALREARKSLTMKIDDLLKENEIRKSQASSTKEVIMQECPSSDVQMVVEPQNVVEIQNVEQHAEPMNIESLPSEQLIPATSEGSNAETQSTSDVESGGDASDSEGEFDSMAEDLMEEKLLKGLEGKNSRPKRCNSFGKSSFDVCHKASNRKNRLEERSLPAVV